MKFHDREKELELLESLMGSAPSFIVITGKRRVGKTELIKQFIRSHPSLYFFVDENKSADVLLAEYAEYVRSSLRLPDYVRFDNFEQLIGFLLEQKGPLVVAFDEFQRFQGVDPSFITTLQKRWDLKEAEAGVLLIASGSSMGMMRRIFVESGAPLFKRADNVLTLRPFSLRQTFEVLEEIGVKGQDEKLDLFSLFGGTIHFYRLMEKYRARSFEDAVDKLVLSELAPLRTEVRDIMVEEFGKEHATYFEILAAMALGKCTKKEIGDFTHVSPNSLSPYLEDLMDFLQVVEREVPVTEDQVRSKKGRYVLKDNFFRFYFRFIYRDMSRYAIGDFAPIKEKVIKNWGDLRGRAFEDVALDAVRKRFSGQYDRMGRFWTRKGDEIDVVGLAKGKLLAMETKAGRLTQKEARSVLNSLEKKVELLHDEGRRKLGLICVAVEGKEALKADGYEILTLDDLLSN